MEDEDRYTRITLRIPKDLHRSLSEAADRTSKSLNAEIIGRLATSFEPQAQTTERVALDIAGKQSPTNDVVRSIERLQESFEQTEALRLEYVLRGLIQHKKLLTDRVSRQRYLVERVQANLNAAEDRGDNLSSRQFEQQLYDESKWLSELERDLAYAGNEVREAQDVLDGFRTRRGHS